MKPLLIRAAGPALSAFGVSNLLNDPKLELFSGSTAAGDNDNWGGGAPLAAAMQRVGAFSFAPDSRDAATSGAFNSGANSVQVSGVNGSTGSVIAEIYDATPSDSFTPGTPRLINVSVLKHIGASLTAGFTVGGSTPRNVLIRAIGPTLGAAPFSVPGTVSDPELTLYSGSTRIGGNDNWGGTGALAAAFAQVAAFALPTDSRDAALVVPLPPGNYTVRVTGVAETTGVALVEIYELP